MGIHSLVNGLELCKLLKRCIITKVPGKIREIN